MTGRDYIAKQLRIVGWLPIPLLLVIWMSPLLLPIPLESRRAVVGASLVVGLIACILAMAVVTIRMVCPYCGQWIGPISRFGVSPFVRGLPTKVKYCPLCGAAFDAEMNKTTANQPVDRTR